MVRHRTQNPCKVSSPCGFESRPLRQMSAVVVELVYTTV